MELKLQCTKQKTKELKLTLDDIRIIKYCLQLQDKWHLRTRAISNIDILIEKIEEFENFLIN